MSRVLVLIEHVENRRLLSEWLAQEHDVLLPAPTGGQVADVVFDLAIVDAPSLERYGAWLDAAKRAVEPLFLPYLLVTPRRATAQVEGKIDEIIVSPVEKLELHARVDTLLRVRALSLANAALRRRLESELARAREVQAGLLPSVAPALEGFELAARCLPASEVGGDFYDWEADGESAVVSVADVMGKGIPAALLAATVRAVLRALARYHDPAPTIELLRETLAGDLARTSSFATLFHARVFAATGEVRYVDAGHGHALVRRASGHVERLARGGRPIGFPMTGRYHEATVRLGPGDLLLVSSDGFVEGGASEAAALVESYGATGNARDIVDRLVERAPRPHVPDDLTVLVLKCSRSGREGNDDCREQHA
jgi:serine phosphatase RsbU (regulator of sigma subunit)